MFIFCLIIVYFDFTYTVLRRVVLCFTIICISLLQYLAIQPSRLQVCSNKISCHCTNIVWGHTSLFRSAYSETKYTDIDLPGSRHTNTLANEL